MCAGIVACSSGPEPEPPPSEPSEAESTLDVEDRVFLSIRILEDGTPSPMMEGVQLRLEFEDSEFTTAGACSVVVGRYLIEDGNLRVRADQSRVPCSWHEAAQDDWYFDFLESKPRIEARPGGLTLIQGATRIDFRDQRAMPSNPFVRSSWQVVAARHGEQDVRTDLEKRAALSFDDEGRVEVFNGCTPSHGDYSVQGQRLSLSRVRGADGRCEGDEARLDAVVRAVIFADDLRWRHTGDRLTLVGEGSTLVLTERAREQ
ncbi:MAG: META domain-containing protein [Myxococcota bacterium]